MLQYLFVQAWETDGRSSQKRCARTDIQRTFRSAVVVVVVADSSSSSSSGDHGNGNCGRMQDLSLRIQQLNATHDGISGITTAGSPSGSRRISRCNLDYIVDAGNAADRRQPRYSRCFPCAALQAKCQPDSFQRELRDAAGGRKGRGDSWRSEAKDSVGSGMREESDIQRAEEEAKSGRER